MGNPNAAGVALAFPDLPSGAAFLARLPLADPSLLHDGLVRFQHSLLTAPPAPLAALQLLEQARTPLAFAQEELARRYLNRPLPLALAQASASNLSGHQAQTSTKPSPRRRITALGIFAPALMRPPSIPAG